MSGASFIARDGAENDEGYRQVIPYVVRAEGEPHRWHRRVGGRDRALRRLVTDRADPSRLDAPRRVTGAIGVDLVEVDRVRQTLARHGDRFLERVFTSDERAYCARRAPEL